jgi:hypothetical protein
MASSSRFRGAVSAPLVEMSLTLRLL